MNLTDKLATLQDLGAPLRLNVAELPLGRTWISEPREVTEQDLAMFTGLSGDDNPLHTGEGGTDPVLHGTFGLALFTGFVHRMGLAEGAAALLDTNWRYHRPIHVGDTLTCLITHTRLRSTSIENRFVIHRHVELTNQRGEAVQTGTSALLAEAAPGVVPALSEDPGSPAWGTALAKRLEESEEFHDATSNYDGTVGLAVGQSEVNLRIYRGRVIDVSRRALKGPDFTMWIPENTWWELMAAEDNELMKQMMGGKVRSTGNGAEYLRLTKVLNLMVDAARELNKEDDAT